MKQLFLLGNRLTDVIGLYGLIVALLMNSKATLNTTC